MNSRIAAVAFLTTAVLAASCSHVSTDKNTASGLLAWSMDQYKDLHSFSATCDWRMNTGQGSDLTSKRTINYQDPNIFSIVSTSSSGLTQTSTSDGENLVDLSNTPNVNGQSYAAPKSIADAQSMQMQHPFFCGTLLYKFFGGSSQMDALVDQSKGQITDAGEKDLPGGGKGKLIRFYAAGLYGHASVLIDEKTGMVQTITYDSEPLLAQMPKTPGNPAALQTTETYSDIKINPTLSASLFKVVAPAGKKIDDLAQLDPSSSQSPVAYGKPAPDFTVVDLDGKPVKLSSFRGKPVFLDFWATWCGPCRESLPHTQKLANDHGKEITVLAISDEEVDTIQKFEKDNNYNYPTYRDAEDKAAKLYGVQGIPTFVVIDAKGNIVNYQSGFGGPEPIDEALAKVGIKA